MHTDIADKTMVSTDCSDFVPYSTTISCQVFDGDSDTTNRRYTKALNPSNTKNVVVYH